MQSRVLVLNLLAETHLKVSFDARVGEVLTRLHTDFDVLYVDQLSQFSSAQGYTHLLISGSAASAMDEHDWYPPLDNIITAFDQGNKAILGICFGHQFLIRHYMGKHHVRQSLTPEIGWIDVVLQDNPIFRGLSDFKSAVFHFDEVFDLDERFDVIACSQRCGVHGFQVKGRPVWGLQFHPDFQYQDVPMFVARARDTHTNFDSMHCCTVVSAEEFSLNDNVFRNWLDASPSLSL